MSPSPSDLEGEASGEGPAWTAGSSSSTAAPAAHDPEIYLTIDETERALRAFNAAVRTKIESSGPNGKARAGALVESLQLTLRLTTVFADDHGASRGDGGPPRRLHPTTSAPATVPAPSRRFLGTDLHQRLRVKANSSPTESKYKGSTVYEAYLDGSYRNWIIDNIHERSGKGMKQLKQAIVEISDYEHRYGKLFDDEPDRRTVYMALDTQAAPDTPAGPEQDLVCVLDTP